MSLLLKIILLATLFLTPLLTPFFRFGFEEIKVFFFLATTTIAGFLWLILGKQGYKRVKFSKITIGAVSFILILGITSFLGINPQVSLPGAAPYFQGWILYAYFLLFFLMVSTTNIDRKIWAFTLIGSVTVVSLLAIKDWVGLNLLHINIALYSGRIVSSFGQPNFYAGFILFSLPFIHGLLTNKNFKYKKLMVCCLLLAIVAIFASYSKTAIGILGLLIFIYLVNKLSCKKIVYVLSGLIISGAILTSIFVTQTGIIWMETGAPLENVWLFHNAPEKRILIWKVLFEQIHQKPLFGFGLDNLNIVYSSFKTGEPPWPAWFTLKNLSVDRSHNYLLDLYFFGGILTLGSWLGIVYLLLKNAKGYLLLSLIIFLIWIQFQNLSMVHLLYFWIIAGLVNKKVIDKV